MTYSVEIFYLTSNYIECKPNRNNVLQIKMGKESEIWNKYFKMDGDFTNKIESYLVSGSFGCVEKDLTIKSPRTARIFFPVARLRDLFRSREFRDLHDGGSTLNSVAIYRWMTDLVPVNSVH